MKPMTAEIEPLVSGTAPFFEGYQPRWIDRLAARMERGRLPYAVTCILLIVLEFALIHAISWFDGITPFPRLQPVFINPPRWTWGSLGLIIYLDRKSVEALRRFGPLLDLDEVSPRQLEARLTTMPAWPIILINIFFVLFFLVLVFLVPIKVIDLFRGHGLTLLILSAAISFLFGSSFYYHALHQMRIVGQIHDIARPFDLFDREPIHAFAKVTASTSIALMFFLLSNLIVAVPLHALDIGVIIFELIGVPLALLAFVTPLWGAHTRLVS